mmetsp:Transcript_33781/g.132775  ORF Transcript_33781/g.132775 Transcript_33781/m.132775 type:complete len:112 (-) Transcript_33781:845-1180(-)
MCSEHGSERGMSTIKESFNQVKNSNGLSCSWGWLSGASMVLYVRDVVRPRRVRVDSTLWISPPPKKKKQDPTKLKKAKVLLLVQDFHLNTLHNLNHVSDASEGGARLHPQN